MSKSQFRTSKLEAKQSKQMVWEICCSLMKASQHTIEDFANHTKIQKGREQVRKPGKVNRWKKEIPF